MAYEKHGDSLELALEAEKHCHRKDNEYLLSRAEQAEQRAAALEALSLESAEARVVLLERERDELHERWLGMRDCYDREVLAGGRATRRADEAEKALKAIADGNLHNVPGVNEDGSVSAYYTMAQSVARSVLARAREQEGEEE